jgi:hypothetical protein
MSRSSTRVVIAYDDFIEHDGELGAKAAGR